MSSRLANRTAPSLRLSRRDTALNVRSLLESRHSSRQLGAIPLHRSRHRVAIAQAVGQAPIGNPLRPMWPRTAHSYSVPRVPAYYRLIAGPFLVLGCTPV